jgi:hypothetical protein
MARVTFEDVVCIDERRAAGFGRERVDQILVDSESFTMDMWIDRDCLAPQSQVKNRGDVGRLILDHPSITDPERRKANIRRTLEERASRLEEQRIIAEQKVQEARRAREALDIRRRAEEKRQADVARDQKENAPEEEIDPAVKRFQMMELDDK